MLDYAAELHYFYYPESIVTAGTSWLGNNFDSVLLYGSLLEAYTYMKGEKDVLDNYRARYDEAMLLLKQLGDGKDRQDAYRSGQVRYPVQ
jgi:predicted PolB exonuclease-like 3'-5' exonuclease